MRPTARLLLPVALTLFATVGCGQKDYRRVEEARNLLIAAIEQASGSTAHFGFAEYDVREDGVLVQLPEYLAAFWVADGKVYPLNATADALLPGVPRPTVTVEWEPSQKPSDDIGRRMQLAAAYRSASADSPEAYLASLKLDSDTLARIEQQVAENPDALALRHRLLVHYWLTATEERTRSEQLEKHALYIIRNHPSSAYAGANEIQLDPDLNREAYNEAKRAWLMQVEPQDVDLYILENAAKFFKRHDFALTEKLLLRCVQREPDVAKWHAQLGALYALQVDEGDVSLAPKALASLEEALRFEDDFHYGMTLEETARMALEAGEVDKARNYAQDLLALGEKEEDDDLLHQGNIILGHVALREGRVEGAISHLRAAGDVEGRPVLSSFGPEFSLAEELLAAGEKQAVLEYLDQVGKFWEGQEALLGRWKAQIERGEVPDFDKTWEE